jgi:hypothetical protein
MVKNVIRNLRYSSSRTLAKKALRAGSCDEVLLSCRALLKKTSSEILELIR